VIGAVLNRVDLERNPYYYAHYYRKEYAKYYAKAPGGRRSAATHVGRGFSPASGGPEGPPYIRIHRSIEAAGADAPAASCHLDDRPSLYPQRRHAVIRHCRWFTSGPRAAGRR
jgi:hypothetical protein